MTNTDLHLTGDAETDALLSGNPLALLIGMLLDQHIWEPSSLGAC